AEDRNEPPDPSRPRAFNSWRSRLQLSLLQTAEGFQLVAVAVAAVPAADGRGPVNSWPSRFQLSLTQRAEAMQLDGVSITTST
ncbi:MAG: hypothetical protein ABEI31_02960, partial [Halodesulfurarchaeum sp.]